MTRSTSGQLVRYLMTGGIAAVVDIGGFALLHRAGLSVAIAGVASFCVAAVVNYLLTARFVFDQRSTARHFGLFFVVALIGCAINVGVTVLLAGEGVLPELAKVCGVGVAFLANFAMNKWIVFRHAR